MSEKHFIIPIFVPHLGCPHDCVFCNQIRITGLSTDIGPEHVENTIEEYLSTFPKGNIKVEVAFYGGSFTGIKKEIQRELLAVPLKYKEVGKIDGIRLSTRPDYIDHEILKLLKEYKVDTIELGVQSLDDDVLDHSGRGHNSKVVYKACGLIKEYGFNLGLQMMLGLIGDTREKAIYTAKEFIKLKPYCIRIYPTLVIKETCLETMYNEGSYNPLSLEEAVDISTDLLILFQDHNLNVIRIGLQPTENIQLGKDVVAGPFHPSFRQLVESNIYKKFIDQRLKTLDKSYIEGKIMTIETHGKNISNIIGQNAENKKYLIERYKFKNIKIQEKNLLLEDINISVDGLFKKVNIGGLRKDYLKMKGII